MATTNLNAYAADGSPAGNGEGAHEYGPVPVPAYVVPTGDAPYNDEFGWSVHSESDYGNTPDPHRLGAPGNFLYGNGYWPNRDQDDAQRHSVETVDADGWSPRQPEHSGRPVAANPRSTPPPVSRATNMMAPRSYSFTRPFDQERAHHLTGVHFSMADHRRTYDILGMKPNSTPRNTYRTEPAPYDADIVADGETQSQRSVTVINVPDRSNRSYRL